MGNHLSSNIFWNLKDPKINKNEHEYHSEVYNTSVNVVWFEGHIYIQYINMS